MKMKTKWNCVTILGLVVLVVAGVGASAVPAASEKDANAALEKIGVTKGICAILSLPQGDQPGFVLDLANQSELLVYFQSSSAEEVHAVREAADEAGLLGRRVFAAQGNANSIRLADNLADAVLVARSAAGQTDEAEILRVLHPEGKAVLPAKELVKPFPDGLDPWSHPYHGPDNNPQSTDQLARAPFLTQFLGEPKFSPMPEVTVAAGGRVFRAFGHIAHKKNQNAVLNTLMCTNGYNGTILWQRPLKEGFMIHRNTMIATPDVLYLADDESCKLFDARTGELQDEIVIPGRVADGPVWKWMALVDGVLYALIGAEEVPISTQASQTPGLGHWPWGMWGGHDYTDPKTSFGFGRTFVAVDPDTKKVLWSHREDEYLDSRAVCMKNGRIYFFAPKKLLGCLEADARAAKVLWKTSDENLLEAIGDDGRAQHYVTGYSTQTYMKCTDRYLLFAGPQRSRLVAASADDGKLLWDKEHGNYQLVLRDDGFYAAGPQNQKLGFKMAYATGEILAEFPQRRACTRATGSVDSIFFRASGGTVRVDTATNTAQHIAPMRPPCQDGVIISDGFLYWGPWMCGCQLSFYGHIGLAPAGDPDDRPGTDAPRLEPGQGNPASVEPLEAKPGDWTQFQANSARTATTQVALPRQVNEAWTFQLPGEAHPTAPVVAGNRVFIADRTGVVRAIDAEGREQWKAYAGGAVYYPPAVADARLYVGSADGRVHAFEAATGRKLWAYRVAPAERLIPVYGKLISTWPVAGGVVVDKGVVYAAAGIAHYDGTYVVALDAVSGKQKWYNDASGALSEKVNSGVSLQGDLAVRGGELQFLGGGVCETARYDLRTGRCLNEPYDGVNARFHTAFYPYYPEYGQFSVLDHKFDDGRSLVYDVSYEGSRNPPLALLAPLPAGAQKPFKPASRWNFPRRGQPAPKPIWTDKTNSRFNSFIVGPQKLLAAGQTASGDLAAAFLAAVSLEDGSDVWRRKLPAPVVKGGTAVDHAGRLIVSLTSGRLICFAPTEAK